MGSFRWSKILKIRKHNKYWCTVLLKTKVHTKFVFFFGKSASSSILRVHSYSILENKSSHTLIFFFLFQKSHVITLTNVFISWFVKLNLCVYFTVYKASLFVLNIYTTIIYLFIYNCLETLSTNKNKNLQYFYFHKL